MKILVLYYTQSGQLKEILQKFVCPFENSEIEFVEFKPATEFPFPWTSKAFFDTMPETVLEHKIELQPLQTTSENYDLIILGYQPWFLSPSLPVSSLLKTSKFAKLVTGKPVITIIGSRNMWINSQKSIIRDIKAAGGNLVANIPFSDSNNNSISAITILYWMLTGRKKRMWNIFPVPGVQQQDIDHAEIIAQVVKPYIESNNFEGLQDRLIKDNILKIPTNILFIEQRAKKIFLFWAKWIISKNKTGRKILVRLYTYYLLIALFIVAPIVLIFMTIFVFPFMKSKFAEQKYRIYKNII